MPYLLPLKKYQTFVYAQFIKWFGGWNSPELNYTCTEAKPNEFLWKRKGREQGERENYMVVHYVLGFVKWCTRFLAESFWCSSDTLDFPMLSFKWCMIWNVFLHVRMCVSLYQITAYLFRAARIQWITTEWSLFFGYINRYHPPPFALFFFFKIAYQQSTMV